MWGGPKARSVLGFGQRVCIGGLRARETVECWPRAAGCPGPQEEMELYGSPFGSFCSFKEKERRDWKSERQKSHEVIQSRK